MKLKKLKGCKSCKTCDFLGKDRTEHNKYQCLLNFRRFDFLIFKGLFCKSYRKKKEEK